MKNSYNEGASSELPDHLFDWAVNDLAEDGSTIATKIINESAERTKKALKTESKYVNVENELADFGDAVIDVLTEAGFEADFEVNAHDGNVKIFFEDTDGVYNKRRALLAKGVVERLSEQAGGQITQIANPDYGAGGNITVGMLSGIGFGNISGLDPNYDVFGQRQFEVAGDLDANVSDDVIERLQELTGMWDGNQSMYNEAVSITLNEMPSAERDNLGDWIEENRHRVGIPGTTYEEVLYDVHRRIRAY